MSNENNKYFCTTIKRHLKNFLLASYTIQFVTTGNTVNSYLTSIVDKTHHELVIAPFSVQVLKFF